MLIDFDFYQKTKYCDILELTNKIQVDVFSTNQIQPMSNSPIIFREFFRRTRNRNAITIILT